MDASRILMWLSVQGMVLAMAGSRKQSTLGKPPDLEKEVAHAKPASLYIGENVANRAYHLANRERFSDLKVSMFTIILP